MSNNIDLSKRVKFVAFIIPIFWVIFGYFYISQRVDDLTTLKYDEISKEMQTELQTLIAEKKEAVLLIAMSISTTSPIKDVLLGNNRNLALDKFSHQLRENTSLENIWFQVVSSDGISLYRSWTKKTNDDLKKIRLDVVEMIKEQKIISSISTGKFDLSFKSMVPIYEEEKFIGFVEVIAKFNSIALKMQKKNYDTVILVDKKYKEQLTKPFTKTFINDYYVANKDASKDLLKFIEKQKVSHFIHSNFKHHQCKTEDRLVTTYHLKDINDKEMAYFILFNHKETINFADVIKVRDRMILFFIIVFFILSTLIYYFYSKKYKNFIYNLNQKLSNEVLNKTKELQAQSDKLEYIANHDALTGLPNRLLFLDRLKQSIRHAKRHQSNIAVLFLDLDRFKEVNDTYGHETGDKLLQSISQKLKECVREADTISRLGGDEFTIILDDIIPKDIIKITNKIITLMQDTWIINGISLNTTFSIGVSLYPDDGNTPEILLRNADTAMYKAKDMGKNQSQFYEEEMTQDAIERTRIEHDLRLALERDELEVYFQPKVDARHEVLIGMEALVRWNHPTLGLITPDKFIHIAEETSLIVELDQWVMLHSIETVKQLNNENLYTGRLSLNLSIRQLESNGCIDRIKNMLKSTGMQAQYLELELTESQIMSDPKASIAILSQIRELGLHISIDDFGTGYSSLSYLKRLPIDSLKIDRSFISELPEDKDDAAIVQSIIALAKSLNLELIAEGVETQEQLDFLLYNGCNNIQGYYYSKPIPVDEYKAFLLKYQ